VRGCAKVREPIELAFGVVSGVGRWMSVILETTCLKVKRRYLWGRGFGPIV